MSRIHNLLSKAEREGAVRRTRGLVPDRPNAAPPPGDISRQGGAVPPRPRSDALPPIREVLDAPDDDWGAGDTGVRRLDPRLISALAPASLAAEQYRSMRERLRRVEGGRSIKSLVVTSPAKGDGKSLTAANLALTMAQEFQQRVLLLDADLRRPSVHTLFGLNETPGLSDILMGAAEVEDVFVEIPEHHLTVLPAGVPPAHPTELLGSTAMRRTLDVVRSRFDRIVIDMPPVAPLADLHVVAPLVDGLLLVVRAGVTQRPAIERALAGLDRSKVLGLVLNESGGPDTEDPDYDGYDYIGG